MRVSIINRPQHDQPTHPNPTSQDSFTTTDDEPVSPIDGQRFGSQQKAFFYHRPSSNSMTNRHRLSILKPKFTENMYLLYIDPSDLTSMSVYETVQNLLSAHEYRIVSDPLLPRDVNMLQCLLDPVDRPSLCRNANTVLSKEDLACITQGNTHILSQLLSGDSGLAHLNFPILVCPITSTLIIGNKIDEIRSLLREQGWKVQDRDSTSLSNQYSQSSSVTSPCPTLARLDSFKSTITGNISIHSVAKTSMVSKVKYIIYCDISDADSNDMCDMIADAVPSEQYKIIVGPLDQREIKMMQHNMSESERHTLCKNFDTVIPSTDLQKIRQGDVNILAALLSGQNGLAHLARPIVVCPINGSIVVGKNFDQLNEILCNDGWAKDEVNTVQVQSRRSVQQTILGLRQTVLTSPVSENNTVSASGTPTGMPRLRGTASKLSISPSSPVSETSLPPPLESVQPKPKVLAPNIPLPRKSKYLYFHNEADPKSQLMLDILHSKTVHADIEIMPKELTSKEIRPLLHLLDPKEYLTLLTRTDILTSEELARVRAGNPEDLVRVLTGPLGSENLTKPIIICPLIGTILIGFKPNELDNITSENAWGTGDIWDRYK
ncbi:hypothetical protein BATDEDRAFT_87488 [Batrachochytrium dendrobatidis JAM81]|uniref:Uncharacterized protein n=2 Tax=Batrachochytrium dendrobatidis TaxID=109871 RepID=F4NZS1_BATDJ|nr:uncharacterized protein BATDEDRAFT_87488 [Batrachochytrium dendrobatidis JAM81]EGF81235.1 hypothetical protein BATDEDRAFT_87488 [Batrachochytrium dendrobatidis JAM81]KAJ8325936.1 hypothetical protein O5D80_005578 [Batrachochytrium dendrobatidis]KAK5669713.1 hypothetical protein QVD99_004100 [Batrachochytrium dendrobatidis]|eukprot:XP_006678132.1 hypothetical protein BATDEDRAFT_87488 [Batrachochytrium dendrobatidis JAM81]